MLSRQPFSQSTRPHFFIYSLLGVGVLCLYVCRSRCQITWKQLQMAVHCQVEAGVKPRSSTRRSLSHLSSLKVPLLKRPEMFHFGEVYFYLFCFAFIQDRVSLCNIPGCHGTHRYPNASASRVLGVCETTAKLDVLNLKRI